MLKGYKKFVKSEMPTKTNYDQKIFDNDNLTKKIEEFNVYFFSKSKLLFNNMNPYLKITRLQITEQ